MPSRPDLRELAANVKEAFAEMDRDTLLEILTFVVKEYVVEGPPPMLVHQAETLSDLQGLSFAQLIAALQTRLDHPELAMFAVDGDQVSVRVGGVMQPLSATRQPLAPAAELPRPAAGVRVVETTLQQRPAQPSPPAAAQAAPGSAPPPARGLSVRGRPQGDAASSPPAAAPAQAATPPAQGQPAQPDKDKPEDAGDASSRFSLLELD
ncbi:MAG TPA: hypothetical protein VFS15_29690 [Kofleriaceae bacterium]|nr:hypothetical protein [Kofleriaceae bacterium]